MGVRRDGMRVSACRNKKTIPVEWWMRARRHADGLRMHVRWISVKKKQDKKILTRTWMSAKKKKKKQLTQDGGRGRANALRVVVNMVVVACNANRWW